MTKLVGINSLRFFAILFVIGYHLFREFLPGGFMAVEIFFCISGFLIASKLIRAVDVGEDISYRAFILMRLKRLFPTLLACVLFSLVLSLFANPDVITGARRNSLTALTFTTNISELITGGSYESTYLPNIFEHTWFLGLIFQLYLLLPLLLIIICRITTTKRSAIKLFGIVLAMCGFASMLLMAIYGAAFEMHDRAYFAPDTHMSAFCFGAAFAVLNFLVPRAPRTLKTMPALFLIASSAIMVYLSLTLSYTNPITYIFGMPLMSVLTIIAIFTIVKLQPNIRQRHKTMSIIRVIEKMGDLSYGLYLFHWPLFILLPQILTPDTADWGYVVVNLLISLVMSILCYRLSRIKNIKRKFLRLRRPMRVTYALVVLAVVTASTVALIRAPKVSSIAEQLSEATELSSEELVETALGEVNFIGASEILNQAYDVMDAQLQLAIDAKVLPAPSGSLAAPNANSANVLVIGDSVTLGAKQAIEATIAKSFVDAKENRGVETARGIIANYASSGKLPSIIVISLGTNQRTFTNELLQDIINTAGNKHKFVLVTAYAGPLQPRETQNNVMKSFADSHDNVYIADWWEVSHDNWSLMYADHIHLNPEGRTAYANLLSNVIRSMR